MTGEDDDTDVVSLDIWQVEEERCGSAVIAGIRRNRDEVEGSGPSTLFHETPYTVLYALSPAHIDQDIASRSCDSSARCAEGRQVKRARADRDETGFHRSFSLELSDLISPFRLSNNQSLRLLLLIN